MTIVSSWVVIEGFAQPLGGNRPTPRKRGPKPPTAAKAEIKRRIEERCR